MRRALLILIVAMTSAWAAAQEIAPETVRSEIDELRRSWVESNQGGDAQRLASLYTEEAVLYTFDDGVHQGREAIRGYFEASFEADAGSPTVEPIEVRLLGDDVLEIGRWHVGGDGGEGMGGYYAVWVEQRDGEWRIARHYANGGAPEAPATEAD